MGDLNIDWSLKNCPLKTKLEACATACGLTQLISKATTIMKRNNSAKSSCSDHMFTNVAERYSEALSEPVGFSDHKFIVMVGKTKNITVKETPKIAYRRSYKHFHSKKFVHDIKNLNWLNVLSEQNPEIA